MATVKAAKAAKPTTFVEKKRDSKNTRCFAITLLVEETDSYATKTSRPATLSIIDDYFPDYESDGIIGDWAVRAVQITPDQFKEGYESF